jgi:hypothetical protein
MSERRLPNTVRSIESFGVSGLLSPEAKVLHEVFYDAAGLGRAADLVAARMRDSGPDEFSLHSLVLFGILGSSRVFEAISPVHFECGMDSAHFALSFSFELQDGAGMAWDGLAGRISSGVAVSPLDELLLSFCRNSDHVVLKGQPRANKVEICAMVRWGRRQARDPASFEVVIMAGDPDSAPVAADYTALGDLDYTQLMKGRADQSPESPVTGEVLVHQARDAEELVRRIRSKQMVLEDQTIIRVGGSPEPAMDETRTVVSGSTPVDPAVEEERRPAKRGFFSRLLNWGSPKAEAPHDGPERREQKSEVEEQSTLASPPPPVAENASGTSELSTAARELENNLGDGALGRALREAPGIKSEAKNPRVERWIEGLMAELNAERSRIIEVSRRLSSSVRVKELEFKNRENALQQHIRERDETIRVKTSAMMRMKEQVAKLQISLERAKLGGASGDETAMKYKYNQAQKLLQTSRSESEALKFRVEELQSKLAQALEQRKQAVPLALHAELERQLEKQARQIEELKRQKSAPPPPEDVRKNLEIAQRVALHQKQKSEQLELVLQEQKIEMERLRQELERLRTSSGTSGPGSGTASSAA